MDIEKLYERFLSSSGIQTDTRKLAPGEMFFALKGPSFNGNQFVQKALEAGASCVVMEEQTDLDDDRIVRTTDTLSALQHLARHHRRQFNIPVLAITGSNGKTTTKELIHAVLSKKYKTHTTRGNLNNHIGIPITLLAMPAGTELAVIEMGANHQKEIEGYCTYVEPTHGIITNCGKAHLEGFGGIEGVRKGKGELYDYLRTHDGTVFMMKDYDYLIDMSQGIRKIITYGTAEAQLTGKVARRDSFLNVAWDGHQHIQTKLAGDYNLPNVLVALSVGSYFAVDEPDMIEAIESYEPSNSRSQMIERKTNRIILDAYNANPTSMTAAIQNLMSQSHQRKCVMLGGMMELGDDSLAEHQALVQLLATQTWLDVCLVGGDFMKINHPYRSFPDARSAADWYREHPLSEAMILVKGSRSMRMELLAEVL
jgi:UDP-N-acetylmuramoyl-tripeptide--D-alanyl-D-alanine ligase